MENTQKKTDTYIYVVAFDTHVVITMTMSSPRITVRTNLASCTSAVEGWTTMTTF